MLTVDLAKRLRNYNFSKITQILARYLSIRINDLNEPSILEQEFVYFAFISLLEWDSYSKESEERKLYDQYILANKWEKISLKFILGFQMAVHKTLVVTQFQEICNRVGFDLFTVTSQIETIFLASEIIVTQTTLLFYHNVFVKHILPWTNNAKDGETLTGHWETARIQVVKNQNSVVIIITNQGKYVSITIPMHRAARISQIVISTDYEHIDEFMFLVGSVTRNYRWNSLQNSKI